MLVRAAGHGVLAPAESDPWVSLLSAKSYYAIAHEQSTLMSGGAASQADCGKSLNRAIGRQGGAILSRITELQTETTGDELGRSASWAQTDAAIAFLFLTPPPGLWIFLHLCVR